METGWERNVPDTAVGNAVLLSMSGLTREVTRGTAVIISHVERESGQNDPPASCHVDICLAYLPGVQQFRHCEEDELVVR